MSDSKVIGKHTPGPWTVNGCRVECESGAMVAGVFDGQLSANDHSKGIELANANLIAAAPDLLEALEAAIECCMVPTSSAKDGGAVRYARQVIVADMIRDAIAKAKGFAQ